MKAPDKIYLEPYLNNPDKLHPSWYRDDVIGSGIEYIRKDIHDETVMSAEDHAYFAGKEKLREALLELINKKLQESADRLDYGTNKAYAEILDKLNEM